MSSFLHSSIAVAALGLATTAGMLFAADRTGEQIYRAQCIKCHGAAGEGNRALGAPALTQLSTDYLARQLRHFVGGVRGAHPGDDAGKRMALSVANLNEADIPGLAVLITTELPPAPPATPPDNDTVPKPSEHQRPKQIHNRDTNSYQNRATTATQTEETKDQHQRQNNKKKKSTIVAET